MLDRINKHVLKLQKIIYRIFANTFIDSWVACEIKRALRLTKRARYSPHERIISCAQHRFSS